MLSYKEIKTRLQDRRIMVVAERTGLSFTAIKRIADGGGNPRLSTLKLLSDYLEQADE